MVLSFGQTGLVKQRMANPDQTAPRSICILQTHLSIVESHCSKFRIITAIFRVYRMLGFIRFYLNKPRGSYFGLDFHSSHAMRKHAFGDFFLVRLNPACLATETSLRLKTSDIETTRILIAM